MQTGRFIPTLFRGVVGGSSELVSNVKRYNNHTNFSNSQNAKRLHLYPTPYLASSYNATNINNSPQHNFNPRPQSLSISTTASNFLLTIVHNENNHAHSVMQSLPAYEQSTVSRDKLTRYLVPVNIRDCPPPLPGTNWAAFNLPAIIGSFVELSKTASENGTDLSSDMFIPLISALIKNMMSCSNDQMKILLAALSRWDKIDSPSSQNFSELWNAIDKECVRRVRSMTLEDAFIFGDLFFQLKLSRVCTYTKAMLNVLGHKLPTMEAHHLVQYGFHLNLSRVNPGNVSHLSYEKAIAKVIDDISLEELGVIAMGLFKTQTFIQGDLLCDAIFKRLLSSDLSGLSDISVAAIFKILRKSIKAYHADKVYELLQHISPILSDLSLLAQLQVALVGCECLVFHPKVRGVFII